jgi:glycosyltransferase involved in cell wall biosynthesis
VSVIIPTLNEARNLPHVLANLPRRLHEVIVVDGFSTDGTLDVARFLRPDAKIVPQQCRGKGDALRGDSRSPQALGRLAMAGQKAGLRPDRRRVSDPHLGLGIGALRSLETRRRTTSHPSDRKEEPRGSG